MVPSCYFPCLCLCLGSTLRNAVLVFSVLFRFLPLLGISVGAKHFGIWEHRLWRVEVGVEQQRITIVFQSKELMWNWVVGENQALFTKKVVHISWRIDHLTIIESLLCTRHWSRPKQTEAPIFQLLMSKREKQEAGELLASVGAAGSRQGHGQTSRLLSRHETSPDATNVGFTSEVPGALLF